MCTDVGSRTITAICIGPASRLNDWFRGMPREAQDDYWKHDGKPHYDMLHPKWFSGPPYDVEEHVFDELDLEGAQLLENF
jgi:hypothetical protein